MSSRYTNSNSTTKAKCWIPYVSFKQSEEIYMTCLISSTSHPHSWQPAPLLLWLGPPEAQRHEGYLHAKGEICNLAVSAVLNPRAVQAIQHWLLCYTSLGSNSQHVLPIPRHKCNSNMVRPPCPTHRCMGTGPAASGTPPACITWCPAAMTLPAPSSWWTHTGGRRAARSGSGKVSPRLTTPRNGTSLVRGRGNEIWSYISTAL